MKKLLTLLLTVAIAAVSALSLSACGDKQGTLVVYTQAGFPPFESIKGGKIVGVDVEIMNKVGEKLNKKVVFEDVDFDLIIDAVAEGKLCNVGAAGISITEARKEKVNFSNEYYTAALYVIYKTAEESNYLTTTSDGEQGVYWGSLAGKHINVQGGTTSDLFLIDELAEGGTLYNTGATKGDFTELAFAVADLNGEGDVLIIDELPAKKLIEGHSELKCAPLYWEGEDGDDDEAAVDTYAICVTKGQDAILNAINEVLAELGESGIQALVNKYLGI